MNAPNLLQAVWFPVRRGRNSEKSRMSKGRATQGRKSTSAVAARSTAPATTPTRWRDRGAAEVLSFKMPKNKRILLTGGAGFIGSRLVARLVADNEIVVFDNLHRNSLKDTGLQGHAHVRVVEGDVLDPAAVLAAAQGCQLIVHLAAIAGVDTVLKMPVETLKVNILGTLNVLDAAQKVSGDRKSTR